MHEDDGRLHPFFGQGRPQTVRPDLAEISLVAAVADRIDGNKPHRVGIDAVLYKGRVGQEIAVGGKGRAYRCAVVAVARPDMKRAQKIAENAFRRPVLCRLPVLGEVARVNDGVRQRVEPVDGRHAPLKIAEPDSRVWAVQIDMGVGDLRDDHAAAHIAAVVTSRKAPLPIIRPGINRHRRDNVQK